MSCAGCNGLPADCARCEGHTGSAVATLTAVLPELSGFHSGGKVGAAATDGVVAKQAHFSSLSSPKGGEGRGEEAQGASTFAKTNEANTPSPQPSPRLSGERENPPATTPVLNDYLGCKPSTLRVSEGGELRSKHFTSTRNACKLCTPLGACLVYRGVEGCIPFLHGSQGCSTYIRRYLISHFREPMDIASSNFHEDAAIFGGSKNFTQGALNITRQYQPQLIGAATTCLTETIGEDMPRLLYELREKHSDDAAPMVHASTPSYRGTHIDGFHGAVKSLVEQLGKAEGEKIGAVNLFPGMVSAADLRHLKEILSDFGLNYTLLPDYSESMDGETWEKYEKIQSGGTPLAAIAATGSAKASIELGRVLEGSETAGTSLQKKFNVPRHLLGMPIGIRETDAFMDLLAVLSGREMPVKYQRERGRLVDSLIDGHKYIFEKRAIVYGDEDLVIGLTAFLCEIGVLPVLCATGAHSGKFESALRATAPNLPEETLIKEGLDFAETAEVAPELKPDFLIGSSKGYKISRSLNVPLIRVGFPIHDRIGGQRVLHLGYRGAQELYDRIVNALLEAKQDHSTIAYNYL